MYAPVSGSILEVNTKAKNEPGIINQSAESDGWILKIKVTDDNDLSKLIFLLKLLDELMNEKEYAKFVEEYKEKHGSH